MATVKLLYIVTHVRTIMKTSEKREYLTQFKLLVITNIINESILSNSHGEIKKDFFKNSINLLKN